MTTRKVYKRIRVSVGNRMNKTGPGSDQEGNEEEQGQGGIESELEIGRGRPYQYR